jgi:hypothetical protein
MRWKTLMISGFCGRVPRLPSTAIRVARGYLTETRQAILPTSQADRGRCSTIRPLISGMEARLPRPRVTSVGRDIQAIRRSLGAIVRALARLAPALNAPTRGPANPGRGGRKLRLSPARRASLRLQGQYIGHLRTLRPRQKARVRAVRAAKGVRAAISLARTLARTGQH